MSPIKKITGFFKPDDSAVFRSDSNFVLQLRLIDGIVFFRLCKQSELNKPVSYTADLVNNKLASVQVEDKNKHFLIITADINVKIFKDPFSVKIFFIMR